MKVGEVVAMMVVVTAITWVGAKADLKDGMRVEPKGKLLAEKRVDSEAG